MTDDELDALESLAEAATPGPVKLWTADNGELAVVEASYPEQITDLDADTEFNYVVMPCDQGVCGPMPDQATAAYIVAAYNAIPTLIAELREAREQIIKLRLLTEPPQTAVDRERAVRDLLSEAIDGTYGKALRSYDLADRLMRTLNTYGYWVCWGADVERCYRAAEEAQESEVAQQAIVIERDNEIDALRARAERAEAALRHHWTWEQYQYSLRSPHTYEKKADDG